MIFAKKRFQSVMPLYFLEFVSNGAFARSVPLSDFYKSWISGSCDIRLFHRWSDIWSCDIKYVASRHDQRGVCRRKTEAEIKSLLQKWAVLRQKSRFHSDNTGRERLNLMSQARQERKMWKSLMAYEWDKANLWKPFSSHNGPNLLRLKFFNFCL